VVIQVVYSDYPESVASTIIETETNKNIILSVEDAIRTVDGVETTIKVLKNSALDLTSGVPVVVDNSLTRSELTEYISILKDICRNMPIDTTT
jgi:hypothetical protein